MPYSTLSSCHFIGMGIILETRVGLTIKYCSKILMMKHILLSGLSR